MKNREHVFKIVLTANLIALAVIVGFLEKMIPAIHFPQGGSILGLPMLVVLLIGVLTKSPFYGTLGGFLYGIINYLVDGYALHWGSLFFDYLFAFGVLGVTGFFKNSLENKKALIMGFIVAGFLRYIMHGISGVILFPEYSTTDNVWFYSFILYNGPYMLSGISINIVLGLILNRPVRIFWEKFAR